MLIIHNYLIVVIVLSARNLQNLQNYNQRCCVLRDNHFYIYIYITNETIDKAIVPNTFRLLSFINENIKNYIDHNTLYTLTNSLHLDYSVELIGVTDIVEIVYLSANV